MQLGKAEQNSPDARRGTDEASGARAAMLGTPPPAAQGELEPGAGGDPLGMPQPHGHKEQLAAGEERAAGPPRRAQGLSGGRGRPDRPLTGEPPSKGRQLAEGGRSAEEGAERRRRNWGLTPGCGDGLRSDCPPGIRETGPPLSRSPRSGGRENGIAVGVSASAGETRDGRQGELRAQPPCSMALTLYCRLIEALPNRNKFIRALNTTTYTNTTL